MVAMIAMIAKVAKVPMVAILANSLAGGISEPDYFVANLRILDIGCKGC